MKSLQRELEMNALVSNYSTYLFSMIKKKQRSSGWTLNKNLLYFQHLFVFAFCLSYLFPSISCTHGTMMGDYYLITYYSSNAAAKCNQLFQSIQGGFVERMCNLQQTSGFSDAYKNKISIYASLCLSFQHSFYQSIVLSFYSTLCIRPINIRN